MGMRGRLGREQAKLHFASHGDIFLKLALLAVNGLIETRILDGDGDLRGQRGQHALVLFIEEVGTSVFEIEHADDAALVEERDDELRAGLGVHGQIARIFVDIGDVDGTPLADRCADNAARNGNAANGRVDVAEAPGVTGDQHVAFFIEQHDGEHLVIDEAAEELADALEERIELEDGGELDGDFIEDFESLRLAGDAGVEAGVFNGLRDA